MSSHRVRLDLRVEVSDVDSLREIVATEASSDDGSMFRPQPGVRLEAEGEVIAAVLALVLERGIAVAMSGLTITSAYVSVDA